MVPPKANYSIFGVLNPQFDKRRFKAFSKPILSISIDNCDSRGLKSLKVVKISLLGHLFRLQVYRGFIAAV